VHYLRKLMMAIFPWPRRAERQAAIRRARSEKEQSQRGADHALAIELDIQRMREENHFATSIAEQLMRRHSGGES
jgi:hypothetical protein